MDADPHPFCMGGGGGGGGGGLAHAGGVIMYCLQCVQIGEQRCRGSNMSYPEICTTDRPNDPRAKSR